MLPQRHFRLCILRNISINLPFESFVRKYLRIWSIVAYAHLQMCWIPFLFKQRKIGVEAKTGLLHVCVLTQSGIVRTRNTNWILERKDLNSLSSYSSWDTQTLLDHTQQG